MSHSVKQLNDLTLATGPSADYGPSSLSRAAAMLDSSSDSSSDDDSSVQQEVVQAARVSTGPVSSSGALSLAAAREAMLSSSDSDSDDSQDSEDDAKPVDHQVKNDQPDSRPGSSSFHPQSGPTSSIGLSMEKANAALLDSSEESEETESEQSEAEEVKPDIKTEVKAEEPVKIEENNNQMLIEDLEESLDPEDFQGTEIKQVAEQVAPFEESIPVHNSTEVQMLEPTTKMTPIQNVDSDSETETYASSVQNSHIESQNQVEVVENKTQEDTIKADPSLPDDKAVFAPAVNAVKSPIDPVNRDQNEKDEESETSHWSETSKEEEEASELNHVDELHNGNQTGAFTNEVLKELEHRTSGNHQEVIVNGVGEEPEDLKALKPEEDEIPLKLCSVGQHVTVYGSKYFFKYGPVYI